MLMPVSFYLGKPACFFLREQSSLVKFTIICLTISLACEIRLSELLAFNARGKLFRPRCLDRFSGKFIVIM